MGSVNTFSLSADSTKFLNESGASAVGSDIVQRFERLTGKKPHHFLLRQIVFAHRQLNDILDAYERHEPFIIFTGRGPSSTSMHVGHALPFQLAKYLQDVFKAPTIIMLTDDSKYLFNSKYTLEDIRRYTIGNAKDILAFGFDLKLTYMFSSLENSNGLLYESSLEFAKRITPEEVHQHTGFQYGSMNIGMFNFFAKQSAGFMPGSFQDILPDVRTKGLPSLTVIGTDVDPFFWISRKYAPQVGERTPSFIYTSLVPSLDPKDTGKMSASITSSAIFLDDAVSVAEEKLRKQLSSNNASTRSTMLDYLRAYQPNGEDFTTLQDLSHNELVQEVVEAIKAYLLDFQGRRKGITDEVLAAFMKPRVISFST
ncbi:tryptophanyl-tRNA synthetase [Fusarium tricinctum]|uniref:tryptophan--tRNA ligase n=1 Tax=Fusarium tricinctum TaxID=61284 RepID=A0A8K0RXA8_9HYPO|nr:tryptophanyl-tRNA synthetase [Fusarium tricinctum]